MTTSQMTHHAVPSTYAFTTADFTCPICMELLYSPRTPMCGHTFCEHCLQSWFDNTPCTVSNLATCPVDRASLSATIPDVNIMMQGVSCAWARRLHGMHGTGGAGRCPGPTGFLLSAPSTATSTPPGLSSRTPNFFLLRTAPRDLQPPNVNRQPPPTTNCQRPSAAIRPTANR